jgi:hypothetical protein
MNSWSEQVNGWANSWGEQVNGWANSWGEQVLVWPLDQAINPLDRES